jgi:hypothetical protein
MPDRLPDRCGEPEFALAVGAVLLVVIGLGIVWAVTR